MRPEELTRLEADISAELSALLDYRDTEVEADEMDSVDEDISTLYAELSFVTMEKRQIDPAPRSLTLEEQLQSLRVENRLLKEIKQLDEERNALRREIRRMAFRLKLVTTKKRLLKVALKRLAPRIEPPAGKPDDLETTASVPKSLEIGCQDANVVGVSIEDIEDLEDPSAIAAIDRLCDDPTTDAEPNGGDCIAAMLNGLSKQEARLVRMRFGIDCDREYIPEEIVSELGLTLEQVEDIEARALRLLRHPSRSWRLRAFLENRAK